VYCDGRNVAASSATGLGSIPKVIPTDLNQIDHLSQDLRQIEQEVDKVAKARRIENEQGQTIKVIDRVVLFVHGFNNSQGVVDNGQKDIDEHYGTNEVVTCAFNWKSAESVFKYWTDQETVRTCVSLFRHFVKCLGDQFSDIHIVAHSMGNYLLCKTILDQDTQLMIFKNCKITCFAADVEISMYKEAIRKVLPTRIVASWNHWYNPTDGALLASAQANGFQWTDLITPWWMTLVKVVWRQTKSQKRSGLVEINDVDKVVNHRWTGKGGWSLDESHGYIWLIFSSGGDKVE